MSDIYKIIYNHVHIVQAICRFAIIDQHKASLAAHEPFDDVVFEVSHRALTDDMRYIFQFFDC